jgi:gliding motility associated protien GldN
MKVKKFLALGICLAFSIAHYAQVPSSGKLEPVGDRYMREANVKYSKRIHRVIDNRQKMNKVLEWPAGYPMRNLLWDAVFSRINEMDPLTPYEDEKLSIKADTALIRQMVEVEMVILIWDPLIEDFVNDTIKIPFDPLKITKYRIMEDWIFDANYSDFRPHIIAMGLMYPLPTESGIDLGETTRFWLKMGDLKPILSSFRVFNAKNNAAQLTYEQFFQMRLFASHIVKEHNVFDAAIADLDPFRDDPIAALLESDRIKNDLFILEHDLWEY